MKEQPFRKNEKVNFDLRRQLVPFDGLRHICGLIQHQNMGSVLHPGIIEEGISTWESSAKTTAFALKVPDMIHNIIPTNFFNLTPILVPKG